MKTKIVIATIILVALVLATATISIAQSYRQVSNTVDYKVHVQQSQLDQPIVLTQSIPLPAEVTPNQPYYTTFRIKNVDPNYKYSCTLRISVTGNNISPDDFTATYDYIDGAKEYGKLSFGSYADSTLLMAEYEFEAGISYDRNILFTYEFEDPNTDYNFSYEVIGYANLSA